NEIPCEENDRTSLKAPTRGMNSAERHQVPATEHPPLGTGNRGCEVDRLADQDPLHSRAYNRNLTHRSKCHAGVGVSAPRFPGPLWSRRDAPLRKPGKFPDLRNGSLVSAAPHGRSTTDDFFLWEAGLWPLPASDCLGMVTLVGSNL